MGLTLVIVCLGCGVKLLGLSVWTASMVTGISLGVFLLLVAILYVVWMSGPCQVMPWAWFSRCRVSWVSMSAAGRVMLHAFLLASGCGSLRGRCLL